MKLSKRSPWLMLVVGLLFLSFFSMRTETVHAIFDVANAADILLRVETEIMQKTPAGRYYDSLFWKHVDEIDQIMRAHPEHRKELLSTTLVFIPELEALLNGDGDKAYINSEHIKTLKGELDWFASKASPALREEIEREQQRLPLENFVGMTMNESWDYINSKWTPDMVIQPTKTPIPLTSVPYSAIQMATWVPQQTLVPNADGKWVSYVHNGVYFEYPSSYYLLQGENFENNDSLLFVPSPNVPEKWNSYTISICIAKIPMNKKEANNPLTLFPSEYILWENAIVQEEFPGVEFILKRPTAPEVDLRAFQYNEDHQLAVYILVFVYQNFQIDTSLVYSEIINERYAYFQHMVDSLRIQKP